MSKDVGQPDDNCEKLLYRIRISLLPIIFLGACYGVYSGRVSINETIVLMVCGAVMAIMFYWSSKKRPVSNTLILFIPLIVLHALFRGSSISWLFGVSIIFTVVWGVGYVFGSKYFVNALNKTE
ncbi:hypothetical protein A9Q99_11580 [Gammaproteobacteria bacterium 45_16_T64]|nr:hypothetical protein A9Q99_11580 [Gammaproteobacteria bacterium 45_16_T64]